MEKCFPKKLPAISRNDADELEGENAEMQGGAENFLLGYNHRTACYRRPTLHCETLSFAFEFPEICFSPLPFLPMNSVTRQNGLCQQKQSNAASPSHTNHGSI